MGKTLGQQIEQRFVESGFERILIYRDWNKARGDRENRVTVGGHFIENDIDWYICFKNNAWNGAGYMLTLTQSGSSDETQIFRMLDPNTLPKFIETAKYFASLR